MKQMPTQTKSNSVNAEKLLEEVLKNSVIKKAVDKNNFTKEQLLKALPLLLLISDESNEPNRAFVRELTLDNQQNIVGVFRATSLATEQSSIKNLISDKYQALNLRDEVKFDAQRKLYQDVFAKVVDKPTPSYGCYFYGAPSTGKTSLLKSLARQAIAKNKTVFFMTALELVNIVKSNFDIKTQISNEMKKVQFLLIDDLGSEPVHYWFRDEVLQAVLAHRKEHKLPCYFASKYSLNELAKREARTIDGKGTDFSKGEQITRLIMQLAKPVELHPLALEKAQER